mgnify:CR=1 FL=1
MESQSYKDNILPAVTLTIVVIQLTFATLDANHVIMMAPAAAASILFGKNVLLSLLVVLVAVINIAANVHKVGVACHVVEEKPA